MITEIRISNFYSIGEEQIICFIKCGKKPKAGYYNIKENERVSLINAFVGANASGKTNVLKAMTTLVALMYNVPVPNLIFTPSQSKSVTTPNLFNKYKNLPTKLGASFLFNDNLYSFDIEFTKSGDIIKEDLKIKQNQSTKNAAFKSVYVRSAKKGIEVGSYFEKLEEYIKNINLPSNLSLFAICLLQGFEFTLDFRTKIFMWNIDNSAMLPGIANIYSTGLNLSQNKAWIENNALEITTKALKIFDSTIEGIIIEIKEQISIKVKHQGFVDLIDLHNESRGTQELFAYIYQIIESLKSGGVVIYDEINRFFHPDIQSSIFDLFLKNSKNVSNAQLFFSSYNYEILNELDLQQIHIVEKVNSATIVHKLSEYDDVKSRDNIAKKYRLGVYGGIPDKTRINYELNELL